MWHAIGSRSLLMRWHSSGLPGVTDRWLIIPQSKIGRYRADFLVVLRRAAPSGVSRVVAAVECDGHDYHERTKEQASRDKKRDRYMQSKGILVLRYTGSDIWNGPFEYANDVFSHMTAAISRQTHREAKAS